MKPAPPIRCDVTTAPGEPTVFDVSCVVGMEPSESDIAAVGGAAMERLLAEMGQRNDRPSAPPSPWCWRMDKKSPWILHLYAVGQYPAKVTS